MSRRKSAIAKSYSIEELALKHVFVHPNDKSGGVRARMNRTFGRDATDKAIAQATEIRSMCDPNYRRPI